ncbi:MAG: diguanylate cyclase response regulator [Desulfuromonas sp.]|nr:MAG: diguanylate cyclase response regulator [Desulfuromonas sp.]
MRKDADRILVVDDESSLRLVLSEVLEEEGYQVKCAANATEALDIFQEQPFDLIFCDIVMPGISGIELLKNIKQDYPQTEVIIITSHASLETAITALRTGAYDYLLKPFESLDLIASLASRALAKVQLERENRRLVEELREKNSALEEANALLHELAIRDGLTGLYNHRYFHDAMITETHRSQRHNHVYSLLFMDLDDFKLYNDSHGHPKGDTLLRNLTELVSGRLRRSDVLARYGGEEFVVILPETTKDIARDLAEDIRKIIAEHPFEGRDSQPQSKVTISIGVATFPEDGKTPTAIITAADDALYEAKRKGRNKTCLAS